MVIIPITLSDRKFAIEMPLSRKFSDKRITCLRRKIWRYQKGKSDDVTSRTDSTMDRRKLNLKNLAIYYLFQINSYCFWVFFPCHSCTELFVNIYLPSNLYPLKWTILLQFHPPYNFFAVNPGQITLFFSIMLKVQPKFTKFHIYCSSYPFFVITQLVHTL